MKTRCACPATRRCGWRSRSKGSSTCGASRPTRATVARSSRCIAVRVPRATGLLPFARGLRPHDKAAADRLTALAITDLEFVVQTDAARWRSLAVHDRGELLGAIADAWLQLGDADKANAYLDRMVSELPNTPYATNAALRRADPAAKKPLTCLGCH